MAQTRLRDYFNELTSFNHNIFNFGHRPGRFFGFDTLNSVSGLNFKLSHVTNGFSYKNDVGDTIGPCGLLMTPQGVLVMEDAVTPNLLAETNAGNTFIRYDLVVFNHSFISVSGDNPGTYELIKGPLGSLAKPTPADALLQTMIGYIKIPAGATNLTGATWLPQKAPDSGDNFDARLADPNSYNKTQNFNQINDATDILIAPAGYGITGTDFVLFKSNGNSAVWLPSVDKTMGSLNLGDFDMKNGFEFTLLINDHVKILQRSPLTGEAAANFKNFIIPEPYVKIVSSVRYLDIPVGKKALVEIILLGGLFYFKSLTYIDIYTGGALVIAGGTLSDGQVVKFDRDYSYLFASCDTGAIQITFDFTNAIPFSVTRFDFTMPGGGSLSVDTPAGSRIIQDSGDLAFAPGVVNTMYFIFAGVNSATQNEVSFTIHQPI